MKYNSLSFLCSARLAFALITVLLIPVVSDAQVTSGKCPSKILKPVFRCGRVMGMPDFERGVECWLTACGGSLVRVDAEAMILKDSKGKIVPGGMNHDDFMMGYTTAQKLDSSQTYVLIVDPRKIEPSVKAPIQFENASKMGDRFAFCFRPKDKASDRNVSTDSRCDPNFFR